MTRTSQEQFVSFLSDMYSVEQQALAQMVKAPDLAVDPGLANDFRKHEAETEEHAALMKERLEAHGGSSSMLKEAVMKLGGKGFLLFAKLMPETPGRLAAHAYSYEAMEWAGYEMLIRFAEEAGDGETVAAARKIRDQERTMMERLEKDFDGAEGASHAELRPEKMGDDLRKHIAEAHALESQSIHLLEKSEKIAGNAELAVTYTVLLEESRRHAQRLEERLETLGGSKSSFKDGVLGMGGLNWGLFFQAQTDTPAKLAAFVYAYVHLKIGGYELLKRTARRAEDSATAALCEALLTEERAMAKRLAETFDPAVQATLAVVAK